MIGTLIMAAGLIFMSAALIWACVVSRRAARWHAQRVSEAVDRTWARLADSLGESEAEPQSETRFVLAQRMRGICSVRDCDQPIAGWCATCAKRGAFQAPKWCQEHLEAHCQGAPRGREHDPYWLYDNTPAGSGQE